MAGALERFSNRTPSPYQLQAEGQRLAMLGTRNQGELALATIEVAAFVTYQAQSASCHVHMAAEYFAGRAPGCAEGVEMMAQAFDLGAAMRIQSLFGQGRY